MRLRRVSVRRLPFTRMLTALAVVAFSATGMAQQIDPSVLGRIQGSLGGALGSSASPSQQLDDARSSGADTSAQLPTTTTEELELRRQRSRAQLNQIYTPSAVEIEYRQRLSDPNIRQFGYDLFRSVEGNAGPLTGEVGGNYVLGVGDQLVVSFQGATSSSQTARVDREGRLVVGQLRPIRAAGRTLGAVRSDLAAETRRTLLGTDVYVSLGSVRAITVFVGGEVERPGQYSLTSLGDVASALARAGGIRRNGSLRQVRVARAGGGTIIVDLYGLLGIGTPTSIRLQDGDRIIVPVVGATAAITGGVARPAIYELRGTTTLNELIGYAGGALRPRGYTAAISRIAADGNEEFVRVSGGGQTIISGDAVQIVGGSAGGAQNRVALRGFVLNPGPRPFAAARTVRELLGEPRELRTGTYLPMAVLVRRDPLTSAPVYEPVNLITALRDAPSVSLRSDDRLFVFGQPDIQFLNSAVVRRLVLGERNPLPQCRSLQRLEALVRDTQSARFSAITRGSFIVERNGRAEIGASASRSNVATRDISEQSLRRNLNGRRTTLEADLEPLTPAEIAAARENAAIVADVAAVTAGNAAAYDRSVRSVDPSDPSYQNDRTENGDREFERAVDPATGLPIERRSVCPAVFEEDPELLAVLLESAVSVGGAVRYPGAYPIASATPAEALVNVAQGLTVGATDVVLDVTQATGAKATTQRIPVAPDRLALSSVTLRPGEDLRVNAAQPQFEAGGVLLSGEFRRPGLYAIRKGETLSQLIARAGGLTEYAYPYGAIFTRRSVKELQQEGFQRTARELNSGLLAAVGRRGAQGDLTAATQLIDRLANIEAPGRVVVESDPRVLSVRPELDTVLESGDAIVMPKTPSFVLALGDVSNPGALQFIAGKSSRDYLKEAGGVSSTADDDRAFLVLPNGTAQPLKGSMWRRTAAVVPPGSTIIVPKDIDPLRSLDLIRDVATIFGQFATAIASIAILATQ